MNIGIVKTKSLFELRRVDGSKCEYNEWSNNLKKFVGKQLAKCVTECKAQASQAKRQIAKCISECKDQASAARNAVNKIKKKRSRSENASSLPPEQDQFDNEWDTDFEDDLDDDEDSFEVNNITETPEVSAQQVSAIQNEDNDTSSSSPGTFRSVWDLHSTSHPQESGSEHIVLQKMTISSEDQPVRAPFPKPPNIMLKVEQSAKFAIPRRHPPQHIQRPPSQPPPPPSPTKEDEYYEVPNSGIPSTCRTAKPPPRQRAPTSPLRVKTQHSEEPDDTYEIMDTPEETYEAVDETESGTKALQEKRCQRADTPPPLPKLIPSSPPPPPLPSKPKQMQQQLAEKRQSSHRASSVVERLARDLDEKLKGNRYPIQTPGHIIKVDKRDEPQQETFDMSVGGLQEVSDEKRTPGAIKKTPPPVHVVKPIIQQQMSTPDSGRLLTNRPLPPVPCITSNEENLSSLPFFHEIERNDAEVLIGKMASSGSFLIRPSKRAGEHNPYTITLMHDGVIFHINIRRRKDGLFALGREKPQEQTFCDIVSLVTYHKSCPIVLTLKGELSGRQYLRETPKK